MVDDTHQMLILIDLSLDRQRFNRFQKERDLVWSTVIGEYKMEHVSTYLDAEIRNLVFEQISTDDVAGVYEYLHHAQQHQSQLDNLARYN